MTRLKAMLAAFRHTSEEAAASQATHQNPIQADRVRYQHDCRAETLAAWQAIDEDNDGDDGGPREPPRE